MRVLIVDDNDLARRLVKEVISSRGWEVCGEARNGQEAVELVHSVKPDVVILDFMMPVKDGLQAAREMLEIRPTVPILLNTLYFTEQLRAMAEEIGVRHVISKSNYKSLMEALNGLSIPESTN